MKSFLLLGLAPIVTSALLAAEADSKEAVLNAAKKLGEQGNYSWRITTEVPEGTQFRPGPSDGKINKEGLIYFTTSFNENVSETFIQGDKGALTSRDGGWQSLAEVENQEGFGRFRAVMARNYRPPAAQAAELAVQTKDLKKEGEAQAGTLTEEGAVSLMRFGRGGGPAVNNPKGSIKFWIKDGLLVKYEYHVTGSMDFNGNNFDIDRKTTVVIQDIGTTQIAVPEAAKKLMN